MAYPTSVNGLKLAVAGEGLWVSGQAGCVPAIVCKDQYISACNPFQQVNALPGPMAPAIL